MLLTEPSNGVLAESAQKACMPQTCRLPQQTKAKLQRKEITRFIFYTSPYLVVSSISNHEFPVYTSSTHCR